MWLRFVSSKNLSNLAIIAIAICLNLSSLIISADVSSASILPTGYVTIATISSFTSSSSVLPIFTNQQLSRSLAGEDRAASLACQRSLTYILFNKVGIVPDVRIIVGSAALPPRASENCDRTPANLNRWENIRIT